jgi:hypothetical protein
MDPLSALLIGGSALASGGAAAYSSYQQAQDQQEYMEATYANQEQAARAENRMIVEQQSQEERRIAQQAHLIRSRIRATAGEAGVGTGGTYEALVRQTDIDLANNQQIIRFNTMNRLMAVAAGMQPLPAQQYMPWLDALTGGISGFSTGLSIYGGLNQLSAIRRMPPPGGTAQFQPGSSEFVE